MKHHRSCLILPQMYPREPFQRSRRRLHARRILPYVKLRNLITLTVSRIRHIDTNNDIFLGTKRWRAHRKMKEWRK